MFALAAFLALAAVAIAALWLADWLAREWFALVMIAGAIWAASLWLYHRRAMARIHELEAAATGRHRRLHAMAAWPKVCNDCGQPAASWAQIRAHNSESSPCARLARWTDAQDLRRADELAPAAENAPAAAGGAESEPKPPGGWTLTVTPGSGRGDGAGAVDTLHDQIPPPAPAAAELEPPGDDDDAGEGARMERDWTAVDDLAARLTRRQPR